MKAIVLAAGEGTRLRPLTVTRPKPMIPVAGKPILEWDLEALNLAGIKEVFLVVGYKKGKIQDYFGTTFGNLKIKYILQEEQLGTGHALSMVREKVKERFMLMNGDLLVSGELIRNFLGKDRETKAENSICAVQVKEPSQFGILGLKGNVVEELVEKPKKPKGNLASAGVYILNPEIFDLLELEKSKRDEYEITDALSKLIQERKLSGFRGEGLWIDIGRPWDLLDANESMLKSIPLRKDNAEIEKFATLKGNIGIGKGTVIRSGSYLEGPCTIGQDCVIGPNCYIRAHSSLGDGVHIGNGVEIKNSIIMDNSNIGHLSYVGDSIIGENCNFGAGTKVANLRVDDKEVKVEVRDELVGSGRRKFGTVMGDNVKTGINVSIMPGRAIYPGAWVDAGSVVRNTIYK